MTSPSIGFRPVQDEDLAHLHRIAAQKDPAWLRLSAVGPPIAWRFHELLWSGTYAVFGVWIDGWGLAGVASVYSVDERSGTCWLEVVLSPELPDVPDDIEATAWGYIASHAFTGCGYRKAYVRFIEYDVPGLPRAVRSKEIARLPGHLRADGHDWDVIVWELENSERGS